MSNYTKTTDFEAKDSLPTGDSGKIIRGAEFETEFDAIATAIATKADTAGPTFTGTLTFETISDGTISVTAFVDEDDMVSDSATLVPTQQSVKAYVDSVTTELQAQDLDFQADSGGALSIDLDTETMTFTGGTGIDTSGSVNTVTFAIDSTVATLTGTQTLTNKTLTSPDVNTPDIDGGTIDGTVIGGTTAAAGSFTTVSATGNITVDGTVDGRDVATDGTKLDGIESGATADQTAAEIRTLVDSATDSNVFTDADHTKLDGIEALADVTDTTNVTAAGAVMDSELTNETAVKSLNQGVATTDSPTFAGLTTTADVSFGDNDKAIFGAGSDLQIYHDGSHSYVSDQGTGNLRLLAENFQVKNAADNEAMIVAVPNAGVSLYYNNSAKLATTSTGIDVTGTVTADGLTVDGDGSFTGTFEISGLSPKIFLNETDTTDVNTRIRNAGGNLQIQTVNDSDASPTTRFGIDHSTGDISFYEDTGTTAKLFWDASAESLGIGTSSPSGLLHIASTGASNIKLEDTDNGFAATELNIENGGRDFKITTPQDTIFVQGSTEAMRILDGGNVGIGTSSPDTLLHLSDTAGGAVIRLERNDTSIVSTDVYGEIQFEGQDASAGSAAGIRGKILGVAEGATGEMALAFQTASGYSSSTERMRIDSSGNLLVGKTSANNTSQGTTIYGATAPGAASFVRDSGNTLVLNRLTNDGEIVAFRKDSTTVGSIGTNSGGIHIAHTTSGLFFGTDLIAPCNTSGTARDDQVDLGNSSRRFDDIYATNGTIQTSDRNEKQDIETLSDAEQRVAVAAKGLLRKFRWKSSVAENGDDARIHFGIIAQDLQAAFEAEGLNAERYAMFINSTWTDEETGEERTRMGVRYSELLAFIIAAI